MRFGIPNFMDAACINVIPLEKDSMTGRTMDSEGTQKRYRESLKSLANDAHILGEGDASRKPTLRCSFCNRSQVEVQHLIAGPFQTFICNECVALCNDILKDSRTAVPREKNASLSYAQLLEAHVRWLSATLCAINVMTSVVDQSDYFSLEFRSHLDEAVLYATEKFVENLNNGFQPKEEISKPNKTED